MDENCPEVDTPGLIRRFAGGDDFAVDLYLRRYKGMLLSAAIRLVRKFRIDPAEMDAEGAVDMAFGEILRVKDRWKLDSIRESDEFLNLMIKRIEWILEDRRKRAEAAKRGGPRHAPAAPGQDPGNETTAVAPSTRAGHHRRRIDLEQVAARDPPVEEVVRAKLLLQGMLERLPDDSHRTILMMRFEHYSIEAIAARLGISPRTVVRRMADIEYIYLKNCPGW
jgi:DNA-directed RNA polymerase specialized sigma24 family protein